MKKLFSFGRILLAVSFLMLANNSCTNLDEKLYSDVPVSGFFKTDDEFIAALGAAYIKFYPFAGHNSIFSDQEISSDEMMIPVRGNDWVDGNQWTRMHQHQYTAKEESFNNSWSLCYDGVLTCNRLLFQLNGANPEKAKLFAPELKVLRAYFYTFLLDMFGNVPIVTDFPAKDENPGNSTREQVFAFIESELNTNVPLLSKSVDGSTYARMHYYVGKAIQAKLYLNAGVYTGTPQWQKAIDAANEVINSGKYSLSTVYADNFKALNEGSKENIFVIAYDEKYATGFNLAQMTLHYSSQSTYGLRAQPWNGYCSLADFYNSFDSTDVRKKSFIVGQQFASDGVTKILDENVETNDPDGKPLNYTVQINEFFPTCLRQAGVRVGKYEFASGARQDLNNDFPLLRLSDIILTKAEALWRLNANDANALTEINKIRTRAGVPAFTTLSEATILAERGRELFAEAHRRTDQIRLNAYGAVRRYKPVVDPADGRLKLFPIPKAQLDANTNLRQNAGYQ